MQASFVQLFQKVTCGKHCAIITGIQHIDLITAIKEDRRSTGWEYVINYAYNASEATILDTQQPTETVSEKDIKPV